MFRDIPEYREVPCTLECQEDRALVGVVEGEHNMMADTEERRRERSLHHKDSLEKEEKIPSSYITSRFDISITKEIDWKQTGGLLK